MLRAQEESMPEGLRLVPGLISAEEERALAEACCRLELTAPVMHGIPARRAGKKPVPAGEDKD
jgi:hypothetical protein